MNTIFIDRDGVINKRLIGDYVKNINEFEFLDGVIEAIRILKKNGYRVIIITNQQGIGKGLMTLEDLEKIHSFMMKKIKEGGGDIDRIYFCPHLETDNCNCRKPKTGMIDQALKDYPDIKKEDCFMIGDTKSDIELAKNAGLKSILIGDEELDSDLKFSSLLDAVKFVCGV
ncbi:MAG TPA: HAD family hydrolase [Spirochaetota bacterium]|nr:HAD family hydrolase [Spirochaetota bacterium]HOM38181.1 HAD family hydrolase [Spirochaetota bacterium]HPQ48601.1 HAD family hydrolase [Spirochaetota bacterium]